MYKMVEVSIAYKHGRYEKLWLNSLHVMSKAEVFATQDGRMDGQPAERTRLGKQIHMILI